MLILDAGLLETTNQWCSWNKAAKLWDALGQVNPELNPGVDLYLQIQDHWNSWSCGPWSWRMAKYATSKCQVKRRTSSQVVTVWFGGRLYENICCLGWLPKKSSCWSECWLRSTARVSEPWQENTGRWSMNSVAWWKKRWTIIPMLHFKPTFLILII